MSLVSAIVLLAITTRAQDIKFRDLDISPADIAYFPAKAVKERVGDTATPLIKVLYSRPSVKGRTIFGGLQPFGKVWRIGANESTEIRFFKPVVFGGKAIAAGTYTLFAVPEKDQWEIILNEDTDTWGTYAYDKSKDIVRFNVPVKPLNTFVEALTIVFAPQPAGANLIIAWDKTSVQVPVTIP